MMLDETGKEHHLVAPVSIPLMVVAPRVAQLHESKRPHLLHRDQRIRVPLHQTVLAGLFVLVSVSTIEKESNALTSSTDLLNDISADGCAHEIVRGVPLLQLAPEGVRISTLLQFAESAFK